MKKLGVLLVLSAGIGWGQTALVNPEASRTLSPKVVTDGMTALWEQGPDVMGMSNIVARLSEVSTVAADGKRQAKTLSDAAMALKMHGQPDGEARRLLSHAIVLLLGRTWDPEQEFGSSLALEPGAAIFDPHFPMLAQLSQRYPAAYKPAKELRLKVSVAEAKPRQASDVVIPLGAERVEVGSYGLPAGDLIDRPFRFAANLTAVPEGSYMAIAEVYDGDALLGRTLTPIHVVTGIEAKRAELEARLAKIHGHESTKATILYPFDLARGLDAATREVTSYNFPESIRNSQALTESLEKGTDPLVRATGDHRRNYRFEAAGEIEPYRIYVPKNWDGKKKLPMIVALHGINLDEDNMLTRGGNIMEQLAEKHGYIVVSPLGYRVTAGYGAGSPNAANAEQRRASKLSEQDVLNTMELTAAEYNVDRTHIYIMGNSAGGGGTWTIATGHPDLFAGMAPCSAQFDTKDLPFERLKGMPVLGVAGELDTAPHRVNTQAAIEKMKQYSDAAEYDMIAGGTHGTSIEIAMPRVFAFFDAHAKM